MFRFFSTLLLIASLASLSMAATTGNRFVSTNVDDANGWVTWYDGGTVSVPPASFLSFQNKSFLTVEINGQYYTNNNLNPSHINSFNTTHLPDYQLTNAVTTKIVDTIRTVWKFNNCDIVQDVYPVAFTNSGQIVLKVKVVNHVNEVLSVQAQFLLDIEINTNDNAKVLTRWAYDPNWTQYPNFSSGNQPVPPFYVGFQTPIPPAGGIIGHSGTGFTNDSFPPEPMGLMTPSQMTIGDWSNLIHYTWGPPSTLSSYPYGDEAILFQWPANGVGSSESGDSIQEIARTSYGTSQFGQCPGHVYALLFYPDSIACAASDKNYNVMAVICNAQTSTLTNTTARLSVGDSLFIVSPSLSNSELTVPSTINPNEVATAQWAIQSHTIAQCSGTFVSRLALDMTAQGLLPPAFGESCDFPILLGCCSVDTVPPTPEPMKGTSMFDSSFVVHDSSVTDKGLKDISWASAQLSNFTISTNPPKPIGNCSKAPYTVFIHRLDSTKGGCINFIFTDCAGNNSYRTVCFQSHSLYVVPDTIPPKFQIVDRTGWPFRTDSTQGDSGQLSYAQCDYLVVSDSAPFDRGLHSLSVVTANNMTMSAPNITLGQPLARFSIRTIDTMLSGKIIFKATDTVGNTAYDSILYFPPPDSLAPIIRVGLLRKGMWLVSVRDTQAWDSGIDSIFLTSEVNVHDSLLPPNPLHCVPSIDFIMVIDDTFVRAGFCVQAKDCAGNKNSIYCVGTSAPTDTYCPTITEVPPIAGNPDSITVTVSDIHLAGNDTITIDMGIDSIWFTNVHNMTLYVPGDSNSPYINGPPNFDTPFPAIHNVRHSGHPAFDKIDSFYIAVSDTNAIDSVPACVTVEAIDGAGNYACQPLNWCYPVTQDLLPPVIAAHGIDHQTVTAEVSDNRTNDRGLDSVELLNSINFQPPYVWVEKGVKDTVLSLKVITPGKSAIGTLRAIDLVGSRVTTEQMKQAHEAYANVAIYAQHLHMKAAHIVLQPGSFRVPIYLDTTDSVSLGQKNISQYQFTFHLVGSNLITFDMPLTAGTLSSGWTVTAAPGAPGFYTITGIALPNVTLQDNPPTDTLLYLQFLGALSTSPGMTTIVVDGTPGSEVSYNGGIDTTITGISSTTIQEAPYGHLEGGTIVIKGTCSPIVTTGGGLPTAISLMPPSPNPAADRALLDYTVPEDGPVTLSVYNTLGEHVMTVVSEVQKQGEYRLSVDVTNLPEGTYFLRLQSGGNICSQHMILAR